MDCFFPSRRSGCLLACFVRKCCSARIIVAMLCVWGKHMCSKPNLRTKTFCRIKDTSNNSRLLFVVMTNHRAVLFGRRGNANAVRCACLIGKLDLSLCTSVYEGFRRGRQYSCLWASLRLTWAVISGFATSWLSQGGWRIDVGC